MMTRFSSRMTNPHWHRRWAAVALLLLALILPGAAQPHQIHAAALPSLTLSGTGPAQVAYNSTFSDSFSFQNVGSADAGPVIFRYLMPSGMTYLSYSDADGAFDGCLPTGRLVTCYGSSIAVGDSGTLSINLRDTFNPTTTTSATSIAWWMPLIQYPSMNYGTAYATVTTAFLSGMIPTPTATSIGPTPTSTPAPTPTTYQAVSGSVSPSVVIQMTFSGGGSATLNPVLGPNCYLGMTCGFPSGYVGTSMSYTLADGSSATLTNFSGTFYPTGGNNYALSGQASGVDSNGHNVTVSNVQASMTITCRSGRGGGCTKTFTGGSMSLIR